MQVEFETVAPEYLAGDRVIAYGHTGVITAITNDEKHALVLFDERNESESVPLRRLSRTML